MGFKMLILAYGSSGTERRLRNYGEDWPQRLRELIPDVTVHICPSLEKANELIEDADAAFGDVVPSCLPGPKS